MAGLFIIEINNGDKLIVHVDDNSPGSEKGLRKGDKIISINGKNAADYNPYEVNKIFTQEGKTLKLIIERDSNRIEVKINLKRIL
jgi:C-terminal processing protease CtpA/Prc